VFGYKEWMTQFLNPAKAKVNEKYNDLRIYCPREKYLLLSLSEKIAADVRCEDGNALKPTFGSKDVE
jgi:hypothetical protein